MAAGDIANIGHTVTYNVVSTVELGQININSAGILTFSTALSTKLTLGHQDIVVNNGGELRVGANGAIIPKQYLAELIWHTTADNVKGINLANGGKMTIYGDPDYYGSDFDSYLTANAVIPADGNSVTITVKDNFTTKWAIGQQLVVHKGGTYASPVNDFCVLAITGLTANGSNTDIACTVTHRPGSSLTCLADADVLNVSRNILLYKLSYNQNIGQYNTSRPRLANANVFNTTNVSINDAGFGGWYASATGYGYFSNRCVYRNGNSAALNIYAGSRIIDMIAFAHGSYVIRNAYTMTLSGYICSGGVHGVNNIFHANIGEIGGNPACIFGWNYAGVLTCYCNELYAYIYSNSTGFYSCLNNIHHGGGMGYNSRNTVSANSTDFWGNDPFQPNSILINTMTANPPTAIRNQINFPGWLKFEQYQQIAGAHYILDMAGDVIKTPADGTGDNPTQRSGGNADVLEVIPQSNCNAAFYLELMRVRLWATAGISKTYRFYIQSDFATLLTAELKLYGEYLDAGSGGHLATVSSVQDITTRANAADWSQYVEITISPAQDGYINLYLRLMGYEAGTKVWVDPMAVITGGTAVTVTPRWNYGDVQLDVEPVAAGGGVSPINPGLVPLGIKQVAI